jgi:hypothetical protein
MPCGLAAGIFGALPKDRYGADQRDYSSEDAGSAHCIPYLGWRKLRTIEYGFLRLLASEKAYGEGQ